MQYQHGGNVHRYIRENHESLESLIDFSANINPLGMSSLGKKQMLESLQWISHYPDPDYVILKEKMAAYYQVEASALSVFNGAAEGLHELFRYLSPRKAIIPAPTFVEYEKALQSHQTKIEWFMLRESEGFALDEDRFLMGVELDRPDLVVICTPNNPTGKMVSVSYIEMLAGKMKRWNGNLVIDEAFIDFLPDKKQSISKWVSLYSNIYVLKSFTKFFGVPGLRLGAVLTSDEAFHARIDLYGVPWRINSMAEHYALGALEDHAYMKDTQTYIETARTELSDHLRSIPALTVYESAADYLLIKVDELASEDFEQALRAKGLLLRNCENYRGLKKGFFRIAVKDQKSNQRLIHEIHEVLKR